MSVNLQMSQAMNVKMSGGGGPSRMTNAQMVSQQQQQQPQQHPQQSQQHSQQHPQQSQHHHQQQQPTPQQHPSMMRAQQQQSFTQQTTMNTTNQYQRNMASGYGTNPHQQPYQQPNTAMQPAAVANPTPMLNTNNGLPPRNTFSPSDFNFDFLDQPLANDSKNGFNNKQQSFGDFNFDFLDAH